MSLRPSPIATVASAAIARRSRTDSSALAFDTPGAAMSSHADQPIAYSTPCTPASATIRPNSSGPRSGSWTTTRTASRPSSSSSSTCSASTPKLASWKPDVEQNVPSGASRANRACGATAARARRPSVGSNVRVSTTSKPRSADGSIRSVTPPFEHTAKPRSIPASSTMGSVAPTERPVAITTWCSDATRCSAAWRRGLMFPSWSTRVPSTSRPNSSSPPGISPSRRSRTDRSGASGLPGAALETVPRRAAVIGRRARRPRGRRGTGGAPRGPPPSHRPADGSRGPRR